MREIWKPILGFENLYVVSNLGKVKRLSTDSKKGSGNYARSEHLISQRENNNGYKMVDLYKENQRSQFLVHRLVTQAFIENPNGLPFVNHKDENPKNNRFDNLEWCTQKYNMNYGTCPKRIGESNSKKVIQKTKDNVFVKEYASIIEAERETGISNGCICDCLHNKRKSAGGFLWEYAIYGSEVSE